MTTAEMAMSGGWVEVLVTDNGWYQLFRRTVCGGDGDIRVCVLTKIQISYMLHFNLQLMQNQWKRQISET
jgi:hypothetical protein